jgi:hypothetical protein
MKEINVLRCEYCSLNYGLLGKCKGYEKKCVYNPDTNSCGSCIFLVRDSFMKTHEVAGYLNSCLMKCDLSPTLKENCEKYISINAKPDTDKMRILSAHFDRRCIISYYRLDRLPLSSKCIRDIRKVMIV